MHQSTSSTHVTLASQREERVMDVMGVSERIVRTTTAAWNCQERGRTSRPRNEKAGCSKQSAFYVSQKDKNDAKPTPQNVDQLNFDRFITANTTDSNSKKNERKKGGASTY